MIYKNLNKNMISKIFKKQMEELIIIKDKMNFKKNIMH